MASEPKRRSVVPAVVVVLLVLVGAGVWRWRARWGGASARAPEAEQERRRVAAMDPAFDPARPAGGVTGLVRTSDGKPVAGALVAVTRNRGKDELPSLSQPIPRVAITDGSGRFRLADVIPGEYGVTATSLEGAPARQIVAVASQKTAEVVLTLGTGGAILTGQVHDVGGGPVGGARAVIRSMEMFSAGTEQPSVFQASADDGGVFKVRLAAGNYDVTVRADGYAQARDRLVFSVAQTRSYRLNPAARLAGRVVDRASHDPVPGASVWLRLDRLDSYVDRSATSDGEGRFAFDDLTAGGYVVVAREAARVGLARTVTVGIAEAVTDLEVPVERGRAIRGNVVDPDGKPLEGIRVVAGRTDPPYEQPVFVKSDAKGAFAVDGLLPARYRVNAWQDGKGAARSTTATVTSKDVEGIRLQLTVPTVVRGQVVDGNGQPVAGASVTATVETKSAEGRFSGDRGTTDAEGKFELNRLRPGKLTLSASHPDRGNVKWGPEEIGGQPAPVTLKLESAASVSGLVTFERGSPASRVIVWAAPQSSGPKFGPPAEAPTDEAGRFLLKGLAKGKYLVMARKENSVGGGNPASRQDVTLAAGEQKSGLALVVPDAGKSISGKVVTAEGKPVSAAVVSIGMERDGVAFRMPQREGYPSTPHAVSDGEGAFTIDDLEEGRYTVWASDSTSADGQQAGVAAGSTSVLIKLPGGASAAGVVHTREGGAPVTDYTIAALPGGAPGASPDDRMRMQMTARMWSPSVQVHDPAGAFFLGRLSPGSYQLNVTTADGQGGILPVEIAAGEKKEGLTVLIDAGAKLTGRVVELDSGSPLEGVNVYVNSATSRFNASTGADGSFTLTGLGPGRARADFQLGSGLTHVAEHVDLDIKAGTGTVDLGMIRMMKGNFDERAGDFASRGRVGFTVSLVEGKAAVTGVRSGFPGEQAGLKQGDLVLAVGGRTTEGLGNGALDYLASGKADQPLVVTVQSPGGSPREVTISRVSMDFDPSRPGAHPAGQQASRN